MANLHKIITSFEYGEVSPRLLSRIDLPMYNKAVRKLENAYALIHGGSVKRPGTLFIAPLRNEAQTGKFIPFVFNESSRFMLVINGGYMQVIKDGVFIETSPGVRFELAVPYTAAQLPKVQYSQSGNTMYLVHPSHFPKILQRITDTNWTLTDIPFTYGAISDATYSNAYITFKIINGSDYFQLGESFTITTTAGAVTAISGPNNGRTEINECNVGSTGTNVLLTGNGGSVSDFKLDGRILSTGDRVLIKDQTNPAENGIYIVDTSTAWTRASDANTAGELNNSFVRVKGGDVNFNAWFKQTATITTLGTDAVVFADFAAPGNGRIAAVNSMPGSTTSETWTITCTSSTSSRQEWSVVGSVSGTPISYWKAGNYPQTVSFFEQRLFFGGSPQFPQHIWGSSAGDYLNFTVGTRDSDAVVLQIAGNDYNALTHLVPARSLMPLTTSTEFSLAGPNNFAISGISSNVVKDHTRNGCNFVRPLRIGREVIFLQRDGKKVRAISYSVTEDANVAPDITIFAEHLTRNATFTDMAFASNPDYIAWIVRSDGQLMSLTLAREFETTAWARHTTNGSFEAVGTTPGEIADDVYVIVKRTVNGATRRYVEMFDYTTPVPAEICYSDSSEVYDGPPTTTISGLDHLEGMTVTAIADGTVHPDRVVASGSITLEAPCSYVVVGLPYTTTVEMLAPEFGDVSQSSASRTIGISDIIGRFQDTINVKVNGIPVPFRNVGDLFDTPLVPFTGDKRVKNLGWKQSDPITFVSDTPTPFSLLGVLFEAAVN
jgi:hypothetical protein